MASGRRSPASRRSSYKRNKTSASPSAESGVAEKLIANFDDLDKLAADKDPHSPLMSGWRYEVFGKYAEMLKAGKIGFAYNPKKCRIDLIETK